jgi:hypothetical protein
MDLTVRRHAIPDERAEDHVAGPVLVGGDA